ncbi:MAG: AAA family ATPase [bacterium]|nr:AAA family ATPase [bacterium]MDW8163802.1 AAA family ATPase [Candidatus Omnitrophota bacterium]
MKDIKTYFIHWQNSLSQNLEGYIYDEQKHLNPTRFIFIKLKSYILKWINNEFQEKIILLPGIRGVGKTTLLAQVYFLNKYLKNSEEFNLVNQIINKIYITADNLILNDLTLNDFFNFYEQYIGCSFENLKAKTLILIDEIHYDKKWVLFLKTLYDRTKSHKNILVIATGSSAILLQSNPDLARRSIIEKLYPLNFLEYVMLKYQKYPIKGLKQGLSEQIFSSSTAQQVFSYLKQKEPEILQFWSALPEKQEIVLNNYFEIGSFPFNLYVENKTLATDRVMTIIDKIIEKDILELKRFDVETITKIPSILFLISESDQVNLTNISKTLSIHIDTLRRVLDVLTKSEIIIKIPSFGKAYSQARKPLKYLFLSPAIRYCLLKGIVSSEIKGKLLEDYWALMYAKNITLLNNPQIFYDSSKGGADFILKFRDGRKILIEVGFNKEEIDQIKFTAKKVKPDYSILIGSQKLELVNNSIVKIPFIYGMLI